MLSFINDIFLCQSLFQQPSVAQNTQMRHSSNKQTRTQSLTVFEVKHNKNVTALLTFWYDGITFNSLVECVQTKNNTIVNYIINNVLQLIAFLNDDLLLPSVDGRLTVECSSPEISNGMRLYSATHAAIAHDLCLSMGACMCFPKLLFW